MGKKGCRKNKEYELYDALIIPPWKELIQNAQSMLKEGILKESGRTLQISCEDVKQLTEPSCEKHAEADTRMFAHIVFCVQTYNYKKVVVQATDSDVFVLTL